MAITRSVSTGFNVHVGIRFVCFSASDSALTEALWLSRFSVSGLTC